MADVKTITVDNVTYNIKDEVAREAMNEVVHVTGDETIGGEKTFTNVIQSVSPEAGSDDYSVPTTAWVNDNAVGIDNLSNCITKMPNNIKYTFQNGVFTLKAGSKVYIPDGAGIIPVGGQWSELATTNLVSSSGSWSAVVYDGTKFLALSTASYISTSTDGTNWTTPVKNNSLSGGGLWKGIGYNGSKYVAITDRAYVSTSTDGVNWTEPVASGLPATYRPETSSRIVTYNWESIAFGNNKWVTCSLNKNRIGYSSDGISWTVVSGISDSDSGCGFRNVVFGNGKFVVLGSYNGAVTTSANGTTWDHVFYPEGLSGSYGYWDGLAFDGSRFIAVSRSGYVSTSVDGITWTIPTKNIDQSLYLFSLSYSNNPEKLILVQEGGKTSTSVPVVVDKNFKAVTIQNDITITCGQYGSAYIFVDADGTGINQWANDGTWIYSGTSYPGGNIGMWYDTGNNIIRCTYDGGTTWSENYSFPICRLDALSDNSKWAKVQFVFQGIGFMGATAFILPGVEYLIPNGRNEDGSCKNIKKQITSVVVKDGMYDRTSDWLMIGNGGEWAWWYQNDLYYDYYPTPQAGWYFRVFDSKENKWYESDNGGGYYQALVTPVARYRRTANTYYMPDYASIQTRPVERPMDLFDLRVILNTIYPVGSIYLEANNSGDCPIRRFMPETVWELVSQDRALWGGNGSNATLLLGETLPNHQHWIANVAHQTGYRQAKESGGHGYATTAATLYTSWASESNAIYSNNHVRPNSYVVNVWRRVQ